LTHFSIKYEYFLTPRQFTEWKNVYSLILSNFFKFKVENPPSWAVPPFLNIFQIAFLRNISTIELEEEFFEKSQFLTAQQRPISQKKNF
jgi:hypothetical protein